MPPPLPRHPKPAADEPKSKRARSSNPEPPPHPKSKRGRDEACEGGASAKPQFTPLSKEAVAKRRRVVVRYRQEALEAAGKIQRWWRVWSVMNMTAQIFRCFQIGAACTIQKWWRECGTLNTTAAVVRNFNERVPAPGVIAQMPYDTLCDELKQGPMREAVWRVFVR